MDLVIKGGGTRGMAWLGQGRADLMSERLGGVGEMFLGEDLLLGRRLFYSWWGSIILTQAVLGLARDFFSIANGVFGKPVSLARGCWEGGSSWF